jgi:hypothetical protein
LALIGENDKKKWQVSLPDHMEYSCSKKLQDEKDFMSKLVDAGKKKRTKKKTKTQMTNLLKQKKP